MLKLWRPFVMRRSFDALKFCLELFRGFWPLAEVKVDAWAVDVPPPMINAPGLFRFPPFRKSRLSGNGSLGTASWSAKARAIQTTRYSPQWRRKYAFLVRLVYRERSIAFGP